MVSEKSGTPAAAVRDAGASMAAAAGVRTVDPPQSRLISSRVSGRRRAGFCLFRLIA
jgi:hypothetical protein